MGSEPTPDLRAALAELVTLHDGPRDEDYERRKPLAWEAARAALAGSPAPVEATERACEFCPHGVGAHQAQAQGPGWPDTRPCTDFDCDCTDYRHHPGAWMDALPAALDAYHEVIHGRGPLAARPSSPPVPPKPDEPDFTPEELEIIATDPATVDLMSAVGTAVDRAKADRRASRPAPPVSVPEEGEEP